mmetsp:Transcript_40048/g.59385  ORF Transcript_40048/g.59385 Transcript_40048/m.59385 type:complete len:94 (+) Transcript_40048:63-344(+)
MKTSSSPHFQFLSCQSRYFGVNVDVARVLFKSSERSGNESMAGLVSRTRIENTVESQSPNWDLKTLSSDVSRWRQYCRNGLETALYPSARVEQ